MENSGIPKVLVFVLIGGIILFFFGSSMFVTIQPGEKGVKFKRFGGGLDKEKIYDQGFKIIAPWDDMIVYDVRETETFEKMEVLSKNGLSIKIDLSIKYKMICRFCNGVDRTINHRDVYDARVLALETSLCFPVVACFTASFALSLCFCECISVT